MNLYEIQNFFAHGLDFFEFDPVDLIIIGLVILVLLMVWVLYNFIIPVVYMAVQEVKVLAEQDRRTESREELMKMAAEQSRIEAEVEKEILQQIDSKK